MDTTERIAAPATLRVCAALTLALLSSFIVNSMLFPNVALVMPLTREISTYCGAAFSIAVAVAAYVRPSLMREGVWSVACLASTVGAAVLLYIGVLTNNTTLLLLGAPLRRPWQRMARRAYWHRTRQFGGSTRHGCRSRGFCFAVCISLRPYGIGPALLYGPGNHSLRRSTCRKLFVHSTRRSHNPRQHSRFHGADRAQYHESVFVRIVLKPCVCLDSSVQYRMRLRFGQREK